MKKAFTLVEVLVCVIIFAIIVGGILGVFIGSQKLFHEDMGLVDLEQNARMVMNGMVREIRQAAAVNVTSTTDISFKIPRNISTPVVLTDPSTYYNIRYYLDTANHQIKREHPVGTEQVIANNVNQVNFNLTVRVLQVQLRMAKNVLDRSLQFPSENPDTAFTDLLTEKVRLRNE